LRQLEAEVRTLRGLALTDPLTGLYNPRYMQSALAREMERTRRTRLPTGIMMLDLDRFKRINDRYGHEAGNSALIWSGNLLRNVLRRIDIPCRYGGEEFVVILPATRLAHAVCAAERLRAALAGAPLDLGGEPVALSGSFGVDAFTAEMDLSAHELLARVDGALRRAKAEGRNCIRWRTPAESEAGTELSAEERALLTGQE
jgi:diguanylate cyclase (GGDEF)-like protein